jgi:hypothetical protein
MKRTSIYLEEEELKLLKHLAVEEEASLAELVRRAVRWYLATAAGRVQAMPQRLGDREWGRRLDELLRALRSRLQVAPPEEIEAEITTAREEAREARRQRDAQKGRR